MQPQPVDYLTDRIVFNTQQPVPGLRARNSYPSTADVEIPAAGTAIIIKPPPDFQGHIATVLGWRCRGTAPATMALHRANWRNHNTRAKRQSYRRPGRR